MASVSLKQIAQVSGVSQMTVSRALRSHPEVSARTRQKVLRVAGKLGYRPDPHLSQLMIYMRSSRARKSMETLAFLWLDATRRQVADSPYFQHLLRGATRQAETQGFAIEPFHAEEDGLSLHRLSTILYARGIQGVLISPLLNRVRFELRLRWERFATVAIGGGHAGPLLHRVGPDHYQGMACAMQQLNRLGYSRIGLCVTSGSHLRQDRRWEGSFVLHHPLGERKALSLKLVETGMTTRQLDRWLDRQRPEVLLFQGELIHNYLLEGRTRNGWNLPCACLDWLPQYRDLGWAGLDQHYEATAANAVDLLTSAVLRNQRGLPERPKLVWCEGSWVDGASAPPRLGIRRAKGR